MTARAVSRKNTLITTSINVNGDLDNVEVAVIKAIRTQLGHALHAATRPLVQKQKSSFDSGWAEQNISTKDDSVVNVQIDWRSYKPREHQSERDGSSAYPGLSEIHYTHDVDVYIDNLPSHPFDSKEYRQLEWYEKYNIEHHRVPVHVQNDKRVTALYCTRHFAWKDEDGEDLQHQHIPVVCLVLGGGPGSLTSCFEAVRAAIPLVLIKGSGRVVELITEWRERYKSWHRLLDDGGLTEDQLQKKKIEWDEWKSRRLVQLFKHDKLEQRYKFDYISQHGLVAQFCPKTQTSDDLLPVVFGVLQENMNLTHESKLLLGLCGNDENHVSTLLREKDIWKTDREVLNPDLLLFCANCDYGNIVRHLITHGYDGTKIEALVKLEFVEKWGRGGDRNNINKNNNNNNNNNNKEAGDRHTASFWGGGRWDSLDIAVPSYMREHSAHVEQSHAREFLDISTGNMKYRWPNDDR
jgi:hypothetical protein